MKIFLDDIRAPTNCFSYMKPRIGNLVNIYGEEWEIARNYREFTALITANFGEITHISFDHDLADVHYNPATQQESFSYHEETGEDCAKWLKEFYKSQELPLPTMFIHSMNPVGTKNIENVFK